MVARRWLPSHLTRNRAVQGIEKLAFAIKLICVGGCASTLGGDPFLDFVAKLLNAPRYGAPSFLAAGRRK
jgi:hypothetical protein